MNHIPKSMTMKKIILFSLICLSMSSLTQAQTTADLIAPYPWETRYVTVMDSIEVAYVDQGEGGSTLLMIHGLGSYLRGWERTINYFTDYRCVALDLPGFGKSSKGAYPYSMEFYREVVKAMADSLDLKEIILMGHSMGGQVAMHMALEYPAFAKGMVLSAPAGLETFTEAEATALRNYLTPESYAALPEPAVRQRYALNFHEMPTEAEPWVTDRLAMREGTDFMGFATAYDRSIDAMLDGPVASRLEEIYIPTLVVYGEQDALIPNAYLHPNLSRELLCVEAIDRMHSAGTALIDQAGHFVHFEQPEAFNQAVRTFLERR